MASLHTQHFASLVIILLLASFLTTAQADRNKQVASANSHCEINCLNGGYCSFTKYTDYPQKGDVGYYQACTCRPGFGGPSCENIVEECQPPYYKCHNDAPCKKLENGSLGCDCSYADDTSELAGYMCRKPTIQACDTLDEDNKSFCTNGGVCLSSLTVTSKHLMFYEPTVHEGCQCDGVFSGEHCEFIKDMPESTLMKAASSGRSAGAKAGISILILALATVAILGAIFVIRRKQRQLQVRLDQPWKNKEYRFRKFFLEKLAKDSMKGDKNDDHDKGTEVAMEEGDDDIRVVKDDEEEGGDLNSIS